jgi:hypothetical protein
MPTKTGYLAVYDYGMSGVWAVVTAYSASEVERRYPVLKVVANRPSGLTPVAYERLDKFDLSADPPDWLRLAMLERR